MISVPARRVKQFGVEFYQAGLTAKDIDRLVKFEVLGYSGGPQAETPKKRNAARARVNWDMLEKRISESETAYQRPVIRRKIDELAAYYRECKDAATLPAIPGAVIISCDEKLSFQPVDGASKVGMLKVPEREGILRAIDGQHRLLALHADIDRFGEEDFSVPAIIFDRLPEDHAAGAAVAGRPAERLDRRGDQGDVLPERDRQRAGVHRAGIAKPLPGTLDEDSDQVPGAHQLAALAQAVPIALAPPDREAACPAEGLADERQVDQLGLRHVPDRPVRERADERRVDRGQVATGFK